MTKYEKKIASQTIVMLEELKQIASRQIIKDEADRLIKIWRNLTEN